MNPIRPSVLPPTPHGPQAQDAGKLAAQRAFFAAALGDAQAPSASPTAAPTAAPATAPRAASVAAEGPTKILRPGSLLDIRV